ncbi:MAG: endonuclease [Tenericutes bacterium]|nr:endonuclease [Mycoplasmatota bacterium]
MARRKYTPRRKRQKPKILNILLVLIIAAVGYWYVNQEQATPPTYGTSQNDEGFYYYTFVDSGDYYDSANNLIGNSLTNELRNILSTNFEPTTYDDARVHLELADQSLDDPTKVWNIYDSVLVDAVWDSTSWHREHVWPNSRLGMDRVTQSGRNQGSDLHNLRAITPAVNSSRSDRFYSEASGGYQTTDDGGFYPGDEHKGDVARILFYMATMYDFLILTDDDLDDTSNHYTMDGTKMGKLSLLIQWHKEDPVDDFERNRNQHIYDAQGNRNPFIDKPEYVHLIWEGKTIDELIEPVEEVNPNLSVFSYTMTMMIIERKEQYNV